MLRRQGTSNDGLHYQLGGLTAAADVGKTSTAGSGDGEHNHTVNFNGSVTSSFNQSKIKVPFLDENNEAQQQTNTWMSLSTYGQYGIYKNKLRLRGGIDLTTNGKKDNSSIELYGGKIGGDWDILDKLTLSFISSIRMVNNLGHSSDQKDNNGDGKIDEKRENWSTNSLSLIHI